MAKSTRIDLGFGDSLEVKRGKNSATITVSWIEPGLLWEEKLHRSIALLPEQAAKVAKVLEG